MVKSKTRNRKTMKQTPESTADYLDRHMIQAMKELAKEGFFNLNKKQTMKQTAVEWLVEQIKKDPNLRLRGFDIDATAEQAKAMEKEQIEDAWIATDNELQRLAAEQYYNETYGK